MAPQRGKTGDPRKALGRRGEELAAEHLREQGLVILSRNWRCGEGELDIVATDRKRLIVCEVKTRSGEGYGTPAESVTDDKAARIRRLATRWLIEFKVAWCPVRFDVVAVECVAEEKPRIRHFRGAF
ncbi:hypothetical protein BAY61_07015 [Prauserella marina]|uniref:UPF0102 protein SAMN05421630_102409 n=1 Tax=Prauserella marina TaxID=530584 RepID=A0A222VZA5_9PSEU|nr:YraN family protein [Prauserella marina]ASR39051.1 hypothetical protein BAY61_07015 [Prauserella marina]PWV85554.1 putative endonuclease [Prauserella marina]SDC52045.1 putative endonuclease [Prauserella marina]